MIQNHRRYAVVLALLASSGSCLAWEPSFGRAGIWEVTEKNINTSLDGVPEPPVTISARECVSNLLEIRKANFFQGMNSRFCKYTDVSHTGEAGSWRFDCNFNERYWQGTVKHAYNPKEETLVQQVSITITDTTTPKLITGEKVVSAKRLANCTPSP